MSATVVRRFDVRTPRGTAPGAVTPALVAEANRLPQAKRPRIDAADVAGSGTVTVSLEGSPAATAQVQGAVRTLGADLHRNLVDLPPGAPQDVYPDQRVLARIDPEEKSLDITSATRVLVAVLDSGVTIDHPDLASRLWLPADRPVVDDDGHGTMLAGTILGTARRGEGVRILPVKFFGGGKEPDAAGAAEAIYYALDKKAHIINLSFDLGAGSSELERAIQTACNQDVLVVIAAGNTGSNNDRYPLVPACYASSAACRKNTIVVMATDWYDERPTFSNFGPDTVDLAAPGVRVLSTRAGWRDGRPYRRYTGSSPAAACVSGAAALLKSLDPSLSAEKLKSHLVEAADDVPRINRQNGRRLNLGRALP